MTVQHPAFRAQRTNRRINEQRSFTPAVLSDEQFAEVKQFTVEQMAQLQAFMDLQIRMAIPVYELAKLQLADFIKRNIPAQPDREPERTRLVAIANSTIPQLEDFK